ncbi:MAG: glycosyltransferase [Rhodospirillales bacterium]|nr:MAG: glycosyltransferase [Rhodospirillales bacterium]
MSVASVSVVIPAYNAAGLLETCLNSLFAQTRAPSRFEVIVVDDASTDDTADRAEALRPAAEDAGATLHVLRQPENKGPAAARNRGAEAATGEVVVFTDSDCEPTPDWLSQMLAPFENPAVSAVKGAYRTRQTALVARFAQAEFEERYRMLERSQTVDVVFSYSAAFRTTVFREAGGFDSRFPVADNEDTDLSYRIVEAGHRAVFNPNALIYHRHPDTLRRYLRKKVSRGYWRMLVYRRFPGKAVKDSYTPQDLKAQIALSYATLGLAVLSPIFPALLWPAGLSGFVTVASTLPFAGRLVGRDPGLALAAPALLVARALALGAGILAALPRLLTGGGVGKTETHLAGGATGGS